MGDGYQVIDIVLFAAIAAFLVFRLRSVLGRRTGLERRRDPFAPPPPPAANASVTPFPRLRTMNGAAPSPEPATGPAAAIKTADPGFDERAFLTGARAAFEIIVNAFAAGDKAALKPLLSRDVFDRFAEAIDKRVAAKEKLETKLVAMKSAELVSSSAEGRTGLVTVKFVSDQINVTRGPDGTVLDGDPARVEEHVDSWTFSRPLRSSDPNWTLVATHSP
jgi:predicted lipid-binding transport protein (Tim44 family)